MIRALPRSSGADWLERLGRLLLCALPVLFLIGRAPADIALSLIGFLLLMRSGLRRDWSWLRTPWVAVGLALWLYLIAASAFANDVGAAYSRALPFGRFVLFGAALQHWLLVEPATRRTLLLVLGGGGRLRLLRYAAAVRDRPRPLRLRLRGQAPDRPVRRQGARHVPRQDQLPGARPRARADCRLAAPLALRAHGRPDHAACGHGRGDRGAHRALEPRPRPPGLRAAAARPAPAAAARGLRRLRSWSPARSPRARTSEPA